MKNVARGLLFLVGLLVPSTVFATHAASGNCKHFHAATGEARSLSTCVGVGTGAILGGACSVGGKSGTCEQTTRGCLCMLQADESKLNLLNSVEDSLRTASKSEDLDHVASSAVCAQLNVLALSALYDADTLRRMGFPRYYDPLLLAKVDTILRLLPVVEGLLGNCSNPLRDAFPLAFSYFVQVKLAIANAPIFQPRAL